MGSFLLWFYKIWCLKLAESEEDLLEHRTDGSDAFDTLYIGCEKFPQADISPVAVDTGGIM